MRRKTTFDGSPLTPVSQQSPKFTDFEHESVIQRLKGDLLVNIELQAKHHGARNIPFHIDEYRAHVFNAIETRVQVAIDSNQQRHLPISGMLIAKKIQDEATAKEASIQASLLDEEHQFKALQREIDRINLYGPSKYWRAFLHCILVLIAVSEGAMSYPAFRYAGFSTLAALAASFGVVAAVGVGAFFVSGYIRSSRNESIQHLRYALALGAYFTGFYFLGQLRADAINNAPKIDFASENAGIPVPSISVCGCAIAAVSFLLFWLALFLCLRIWRNKRETDQERDYYKKVARKEEAGAAIELLRGELQALRTTTNEQVGMALARFEYALSVENDLIGFARIAADRYKECNLRYRTDGLCPHFYSFPPQFQFNRFFNNSQNQ